METLLGVVAILVAALLAGGIDYCIRRDVGEAALIGLIVVCLGACLGGFIVWYQVQSTDATAHIVTPPSRGLKIAPGVVPEAF